MNETNNAKVLVEVGIHKDRPYVFFFFFFFKLLVRNEKKEK